MRLLAFGGVLFGFWLLANGTILLLQWVGIDAVNANGYAGVISGMWVALAGRWLIEREARK